MDQKKLFRNGKKIVYYTIGDGPVVVLAHGFGETASVWKNQFHSFPDFKLIIPDLPGSGASDMIEDMSMEGIAEVLKAIIVHEEASLFFKEGEPGSVVMIGHSMGGYISLAFAEKYPQMLKGLGLFHSTAFADTEEKKETRRKGIDFIEKNGAFDFLKATAPNLFSELTKEKNPTFIEQHLDSVRNFSTVSLVSYYKAMMARPERSNILKEINIPILIVAGKYDNAVPLKESLTLAHIPELSYFHILDNSGHMGMIEERAATNLLLSDYLKRFQTTVQP